ncbi:unnamed protein product [Orchesella dallaii]|uniref:Peptidase aspartic putative domain-containing protein n=1 Tax=Orchesella dallaii TaxID=48710 RepID=A0ABP1PIY1_9HEXA
MKQPTEHWNSILIYITTEKLDPETKKYWAMKLVGTSIPTFNDLNQFLEQHIRGLMASGQLGKSAKSISQGKTAASHHISSNSKCVICDTEHSVYQCKTFVSATVAERNNLVKKHRLCFNCLRNDHRLSTCKSYSTCRKCQKKHHTMLHLDNSSRGKGDDSSDAKNSSSANTGEKEVASHFASEEDNEDTHVLLATAIVKVIDRSGGQQLCRVLLDQGSQASFISEACARNLGLKRQHSNITITGISGGVSASTRGKVNLTLHSTTNDHAIDIHALVLKKVTGWLPKFMCENNDWMHLNGLQLADPHYFQPGNIDILHGADYTGSVMLEGIRKGKRNTPIGQLTMFGWVLSGTVPLEQQRIIHAHHVTIEAEDILQKFWEIEEIPTVKHLSPVEQQCEDHFKATYSRRDDGKFEVELPFNSKLEQLGNSKNIAINRLKQVERRLAKLPEQRQQYNKFMSDYISLGHMELIPAEETGEIVGRTNYLPHHYVMKTAHSATKFRVVFDGSAKSSSGVSLNGCLQVGPTVQDDCSTVLVYIATTLSNPSHSSKSGCG